MGFGTSSPDGPETAVSHYTAIVVWERNGAAFSDKRYSRAHRWIFDGGIELPASPSPYVVRPPISVAKAVDPEETFVASLASCHMLSFLYVAAKRGYVVESYRDEAAGTLAIMGYGASQNGMKSSICPTLIRRRHHSPLPSLVFSLQTELPRSDRDFK